MAKYNYCCAFCGFLRAFRGVSVLADQNIIKKGGNTAKMAEDCLNGDC